jgi:integrase
VPVMDLGGQRIPYGLRGPVLVDDLGLPRYWAAFWMARFGQGWADSTQAEYLRTLERLYAHVDGASGASVLDALIGDLEFHRLESILERYFAALRNEQSRTGRPRVELWRVACTFLSDCLDALVQSGRSSDREGLQRIVRMASWGDGLRGARRRRRRARIRALPSSVVEELYELTWPESRRNPFRTSANRHRNLVLFLLLLHQGLRRSETLLLPVDAIHNEWDGRRGEQRSWLDVIWNPYEEDDERADRPSIKTEWSVRQIPVAPALAVAVENYAENHRGRRKHSFLLVSQEGGALSQGQVNDAFRVVSGRLSIAAKRELWNRHRETHVSPHDLRHTCAVFRLRQLVASGVEFEQSIEMLRNFFGWSPRSEMPRHYARAYFDERLATVWNADFDARVEVLRSLR